nr:hypothetical protein [Tanacetum cinerariifolium]
MTVVVTTIVVVVTTTVVVDGFRDSASIDGVHLDFADRVAPPALFSLLCAMDYDELYTEFNVGSAQQMRHEAEAAKAIRLRGQLSTVEATNATRNNKLRNLEEKNLALEEDKSVLSGKSRLLSSWLLRRRPVGIRYCSSFQTYF